MHFIDQSEKSEIVKVCFGEHYPKKELYLAISRNEERQNSKVLQCDIVKKVFVRYPGSSLAGLDMQIRQLWMQYTIF